MSALTNVLARALQLVGALVIWYGGHGMFTTAGLMPPNVVVVVGILIVVLAGLAAARVQARRQTGWWLALAAISIPFVLLAMPSGAGPECPPDHPPLTEAYYCAAPRPLPVFVLALAGIAVSAWGAWRDLASLGPRVRVGGAPLGTRRRKKRSV